MIVTIGGKRWDLVFSRIAPTDDAVCDPPNKKGKQIRLAPKLRRNPKLIMDRVIHESLHAADWTKDEGWVEATAAEITRILWKLGFRLDEKELLKQNVSQKK